DGEETDNDIADGAALAGGVHPERHPDDADDVAEQAELEGGPDPTGDDVADGKLIGVRSAKVKLRDAAQPFDVLNRQGIVEAEALPHSLKRLGRHTRVRDERRFWPPG